MSPNGTAQDGAPRKKQGHRPCDMCRRKKRRCDGNEPCDHCIKHGFACTYQQKAMQRLSEKSTLIQTLETRLENAEMLLREFNGAQTASPQSSANSAADTGGPGVQIVTSLIRGLCSPPPPPHVDEIEDSFRSLSLDKARNQGFLGKASQATLVKAAVDLKSQTGLTVPKPANPPPWTTKPWDHATSAVRQLSFPPPDLMPSLISLYFSNFNSFFPLLHRPTFERAVAASTHLSDAGFAGTLLLACALGARHSGDPRVHLPNLPFGTAGWKWYDQVQLTTLAGQPTLYDLQSYCLAVQFLDRASVPRASWTLAGFGLRLTQDIGAHRQKLSTAITPEEEQEKRAYWILVLFDAQLSGALGRSVAVQALHDVDLDMPLPCDDEYRGKNPNNPNPIQAFQQPEHTPSLVEYFNCQLNLNRILSLTLKVLYSSCRMKALIGMNDDAWEEKTIMEFDSALNTWFDSVPAHLRWDPARIGPDDVFFDQSAALYCNYYLTQILIHRPFIPAMRSRRAFKTTIKGFPSLTICNNAARACSRVVEAHTRRRPNNPLPFAQTAVFTAGIVLLLNMWSGRGKQVQAADLGDVHRCIDVLRAYKVHCPATCPLLYVFIPFTPCRFPLHRVRPTVHALFDRSTLEQLVKVEHVSPVAPKAANRMYGASPSPFVPSGIRSASTSSYALGHGVPQSQAQSQSHSRPPPLVWPAYDPALETQHQEYQDMLNHSDGFPEAPARPPAAVYPQVSGSSGYPTSDIFNSDSNPALYTPSGIKTMQQWWDEELAPMSTEMDMDMDTMAAALWAAAPSNFEVGDWNSYLNTVTMHSEEQ
ncbi:fungal-specific transcription factor domain-containing protein [Mycena vitilis]|nr:fungal-specific transcription factor domain-containing protein [Mycena vitilis]